jgi:hypothetical protein
MKRSSEMTRVRSRIAWTCAVVLLAAVGGFSASVRAQDSADDRSVALATELIDLAGSKAVMVQTMDRMEPMLTQLIEKSNPGKEADVEDVMKRFVLPKMRESLPDLLHASALLYAKHFSADELQQLVDFYKSPIGRKFVSELPAMLQEMSTFAAAKGQQIAIDALKAYQAEFQKRGLQLPI